MDIRKHRLKVKDIYRACSPSIFKFNSTAEVKPLEGIIGQERAVRSLGFALDIGNEGYNIYLAGYYGTGKTTLAREMLEQKARKNKVPSDWCYVNNFKNPENPHALSLPAGLGKEFKNDVDANMDMVIKHIVKAFEGEDFEFQKSTILNRFMEDTNKIYLRLEDEARTYNFTISRSQNGVSSIPLKEDGSQMSQDEYMALPEDERTELMKKSSVIQEKINEAFRQYKELEKKIKEEIKELELSTARQVAEPDFNALYKKYAALEQVVAYLRDMHQDVLDNLEMFKTVEDDSPMNILRRMDKRALIRRYQVNQIVDNSALKHAPVVFETNPSFSNLFGQVEFGSEFGVLTTDFSRIKAGSVHKANGGYLVINVYDIIKNFYVWDKLKRIIKNKEIIVESLSKNLGLGNSETLQPEAVPVEMKVVLIGEPEYYYLLHAHDEEFKKLFKIKADFDTDMQRTPKHMREYARLVSSVCTSKNLRHYTPAAVAEIVDYGSRMADDQGKLSTLFNKLVEIIYEANCWAGYAKAELVDREHVKRAVKEKHYRSAMLQEKMQGYIDEGTIMIDVDGYHTGQLNGLAVYQIADHQFGKPVRITAKTFMGEKGLVNIEREIQLSGSIHSKGILTLNGYLGAQYAQNRPLSLSASLTLEQSYGGIEGDSASSAELYALLSSLADVPLQQGIAVTGSVNQNGEIQAIGGVNAKIEGFFRVCQNRGLTGRQGVIIPHQNVKNLMLNEEVVAAVKADQFNIWAISHVNEGLEILTGVEAGEANAAGDFPPNSIHCLVSRKLSSWGSRSVFGMMGDIRPVPRKNELRRRARR
ncbi:MAG: ATP-binding protein [Syntrophomonadaceae bacterium]|nr:ATP-binding protein [Syntrophomonadaceae bacterium]